MSCGGSWTNNGVYCCDLDPNKDCQFWGVAYQWLIVTAFVWILAVFSEYIVDLLIALLSLVLIRYRKRSWLSPLKRHVASWTTHLVRWGLIWAGFVTLHLPSNVYNIFRYFLSIPFFIILLLFINALFDAVSKIARLESDREHASASKTNEKADEKAKRAAMAEQNDIEDSLTPILGDHDTDKETGEGERVGARSSGVAGSAKESSLRHAIEEGVRVIKYIVFLLVIILGLQSNDVPVVSFFQNATIFTLSVVFAAQPWIRNLIGGLMVLFDDKFAEGNYVRVVGVEGSVLDITLRTTKLQRPDKSIVYIPNSRVLEQPVINFSRGTTRLLEVRMKLSPETRGDQIRKLLSALEHTLQTLHPSLTSHPVNQNHGKLGDATEFYVVLDQMFEVLIWTHTSGNDTEDKRHADIQSEIMLAVSETMANLGIESEAQYYAGSQRKNRNRQVRNRQDPDGEPGEPSNSDDNEPPNSPPERGARRRLIREQGAATAFMQDEYTNDDLDLSMTAYQALAS